MAKSGSHGDIQLTSLGESVEVLGASTEHVVASEATYKLVDVDYIDPSEDVDIFVNGVYYTGKYTVDYLRSTVTLNEYTEDDVEVNCYELTTQTIGGFFEWNLDLESDNEDVTTFGSDGWKESINIVKGGTISASSYFEVDEDSKIKTGNTNLVRLYLDKNQGAHFVCFAVITGKGLSTPVGGVIESNLDMQVTGEVVFVN